MVEFGTKEYYKERSKELEELLKIYIAALKEYVLENKSLEDIFSLCEKILSTKNNLDYAKKQLNDGE